MLNVIIGWSQILYYNLVNQNVRILTFSEMILCIRGSIVPRYCHPTMCLIKNNTVRRIWHVSPIFISTSIHISSRKYINLQPSYLPECRLYPPIEWVRWIRFLNQVHQQYICMNSIMYIWLISVAWMYRLNLNDHLYCTQDLSCMTSF